MDIHQIEKQKPVETPRPALVPADSNNNAAASTRRPRTREVSSRYRSPDVSSRNKLSSSAASSIPKRCPSPTLPRTTPSSSSQVVSKRAQSADRRRPSTPPTPKSPSTPVRDSSVNVNLSSRRPITGGRSPESLWPSTMRSLNVSFQSDSISVAVSKKEKPTGNVSYGTLRSSSNVSHRQGEPSSGLRRPTSERKKSPMPERKRSPLKDEGSQDQSENNKPADGSRARLIDQHMWPSRLRGKISSNSLNRSVDLTDRSIKTSTLPGSVLSSLGRSSLSDDVIKPLRKAASDVARRSSLEEMGRPRDELNPIDDKLSRLSGEQKIPLTTLSERISSTNNAARGSRPPSPSIASTSGSRPPSPSRTSISRGVSPVRSRGVSPVRSRGVSPVGSRPSTPPRGVSPSRVRTANMSAQSSSSTSVLTFIADFKGGRKGATYIEDAHQLRLFYNRYLQWRYANARAEAVSHIQKVTAEKTLYSVWYKMLLLWDSVIRKKISLQQNKLEFKLNAVLNDQMTYLDDWALMERVHIDSLSRAVKDLEVNTLRLPVTLGAKADVEYLKLAICSALDVVQAMGSSICSLLPKVEGANDLVSDVAVVATREKAMLGECEALLSSTAAKQVEECSNRTQLIQVNQVILNQRWVSAMPGLPAAAPS